MRLFLFACLLLTMIFNADSAAPVPPGPYAARWKKIDALLAKSQTATAAPLVEAIYRQAKKAGNSPAYVRALLYKVRLLQAKQEDSEEKAIALLETDLKTATFPARPILHSLLAEHYTDYLNQNRYRLYQRTAGASPTTDDKKMAAAGTDLATWDLGRVGAAIVRHYYQSVEDEPQKQLKTTLADLDDLIAGGDAEGRALRPTLYDLLAQRAIEGLQHQELYVTKPEQQFQPTEPKLFGTAEEFAALKLTTPEGDSLNGQLHALYLLQRLTASRQQLALSGTTPQNVAALADADLSRIDYLHGLTQDTDLAAQYEPALVRLAKTYKSLPISTEFMARRAEAVRETGDNVAAVRLAREAEARFPKSRGAARARLLRAEIERPKLAFSASDIVIPNQPWRLDVTARNVTSLHAWAYRISLKEWTRLKRTSYGDEEGFLRGNARTLKSRVITDWSIPVPKHLPDYKEQKLSATGAGLPVGYYLLIVSNQESKPLANGKGIVTSHALIGASELSIVTRRNPDTGTAQLLVLDRKSGTPIAGAKAQARYDRYDQKREETVGRLSTVNETVVTGLVELPAPIASTDNTREERVAAVSAWLGKDSIATDHVGFYYPSRQNQPEQAQRQTFLFTDRAIYHPGQTVYFKGILTESLHGKAHLLTGQPVVVGLMDVNGQPVQTLPFTTSEFGSFNGSLVLPTGLLNGEMRLQTDHGSLQFAVEDYKRPTFLVSIDSVPGRPQLGQPLTVSGRSRAYAGQATDGATVRYRVTRRELWPLFDYEGGYGGRGIYAPGRGQASQEIAHGTTTTDAEGRFSLSFTPPLVPRGRASGVVGSRVTSSR